MLECLGVGALDGWAVGDGVCEGDAEFDDIYTLDN